MTKMENPFMPFDATKLFGEFGKAFGDFKFPTFDNAAFNAAQQKNLEIFAAANKKAVEGYQAVAKRQAELFQESFQEFSGLLKGAMSGASPEATATKQAEVAKQALERGLTNLRELAELAAKANAETYEILNKRLNESLEEMRAIFSGMKK